MNILFILDNYHFNKTGAMRAAQYAIKPLASLGHTVNVAYHKNPSTWHYANPIKYSYSAVIINSLSCFSNLGLTSLIKKISFLYKCKIFIYWHETEWTFDKFKECKTYKTFYKFASKEKVIHLVTSKRAGRFVESILPDCQTEIVYECCMDQSKLLKSKLPISFSKNKKWIIGLGSIQERKGTDIFIETAIKVLNQYDNVGFIWLGEDLTPTKCFYEKCMRRLKETSWGDDIIFPGYVDPPSLLLRAADIVFIPSRDDPLPLAGLEGMSLGKPILCADIGGLPEALNGLGLVTESPESSLFASKIGLFLDGKLTNNPELIYNQYEKNFTPEAFANRLHAILRKHILT